MNTLLSFLVAGLSMTALLCGLSAPAEIVVFSQPGFPTTASQPLAAGDIAASFGSSATLADLQQLRSGDVLRTASLLVLPYGSAFPADAWPAIESFLHHGGNLLLVGGQPLRVPVLGDHAGAFTAEAPQDSYSRALGFRHSYAVPLGSGPLVFHWRAGYSFLPSVTVHATRVFAEEGRLEGLGYLDAPDGTHLAAPVIVADSYSGGRIVALPFSPAPGYWSSPDGLRLLRAAADYARAGATRLQIETEYAALRPGEMPQLTAHLWHGHHSIAGGSLDLTLTSAGKLLQHAHLSVAATDRDIPIPFHDPLAVGTYIVEATYTPTGAGHPQEFAENGFEVENLSSLENGEALGVRGNFLSLGGQPFFPVGTNYFTTEENGWDFSSSRNAATWERDFADMQRHNVSLVRTGVWMGAKNFANPQTGAVSERFLRNLEAYLAAAHCHHIAVNFTFFAFTPQVFSSPQPDANHVSPGTPPPPNPYLDPAALAAEKGYIASVVTRFGKLPWLSWDLINEPSFSNPREIFHGNLPNNDPTEQAAWHTWLQKRYASLNALADAWRVTPAELHDFNAIPLPSPADLVYDRYDNPRGVRALDYNLFAQDMFSAWVRGMVATIRAAGSRQLINVGQDEGGVTNRLLNQFYATSGVSFTTNHTYWQDDALLWDSVAAKRPGMPNITGETGYQPAWNPDGTWRYDELTGASIIERKWALGFAAGSSGVMQWDWAREPDFGMQRSDGSAKIWEPMMQNLGAFAKKAEPYATDLTLPDIALVLPQSLQMSVDNSQAVKAQQTAVRVLYQYDRAEAYAVGEFQIDTLGTPKLIILPSAFGLSNSAWSALESRVRAGAVLLISGSFSGDEHMHPTDRAHSLGLDTALVPLQLRDQTLHLPTGAVPLSYRGMTTTVLDQDTLPNGQNFTGLPLGKGRILFSTLPLELNSDLASIAQVYAYAIDVAQITPTYTTPVKNPGILICPTRLPHATLYVLTSETETMPVTFTDARSGKTFSSTLNAGRAALLLIGEHGNLISSYNWRASE